MVINDMNTEQAFITEIKRVISDGSFDSIIDKDGVHYEIKMNSFVENDGVIYRFVENINNISKSSYVAKNIKTALENDGWGYANCDTMMIGYGYIKVKLYPDVPKWYKK